MASVQDYYSSSPKLAILKTMVRTKGSAQRGHWTEKPKGPVETTRSYFLASHKGKTIFIKQVNRDYSVFSAKELIEHNAHMLYLLRDLPFVPRLYFYNEKMLGMEYIRGEPLKEYLMKAHQDKEIETLIKDIEEKTKILLERLNGTFYDLSYNNILVHENKAHFIDFDIASKSSSPQCIIRIIRQVHQGKAHFTNDGHLITGPVSRIKYVIKRSCPWI